MATKVEAARLLMLKAARLKDAGERSDVEAGMAKLFASETGKEVVEDSFRIHGGYGYSKEYEIERLYRDAPLLLIGEGTSEIQRMVIGRKLDPAEPGAKHRGGRSTPAPSPPRRRRAAARARRSWFTQARRSSRRSNAGRSAMVSRPGSSTGTPRGRAAGESSGAPSASRPESGGLPRSCDASLGT